MLSCKFIHYDVKDYRVGKYKQTDFVAIAFPALGEKA